MIKLFGWSIGRDNLTKEADANTESFVLNQKEIDDGAITITQGAHYGTYVDLEGSVRNEIELIDRYREMAQHPECADAINEIVTEAISIDVDDGDICEINLDKLEVSESIKNTIIEEFTNIKTLLNFRSLATEIFRRWYVDGRMTYHIVINTDKPTEGIKELRYIDPRKIRKVREIIKERDPKTGGEIIKSTSEYFIFNERGLTAKGFTGGVSQGLRIAPDAIISAPSGLLDAKSAMITSWLHKAIKSLNQIRMIEDAIVIYRLSRAPERRIFYIDVGNLPKLKAEQYLRDIMSKYRNKLVYDASTGEIKDERKHLSMLEDFWLPRREGGRGTEIKTLDGGQNLGQLEDVIYFQKKLYKSLNVPIGRLDPQTGGGMIGIGRAAEVTRDEVKFFKFITGLRAKFSQVFFSALRIQLTLKGVCTLQEWDEFKEKISFKYTNDNNFAELRDMELWNERLTLLSRVDVYVGKYFSMNWVNKNVLQLSEEEAEEMRDEIEEEIKRGLIVPPGIEGQPGDEPSNIPGAQALEQSPPKLALGKGSATPGLDKDVEDTLSNAKVYK